MKWEYMIGDFADDLKAGMDELEWLCRHGDRGWELVKFDGKTGYFKRPLFEGVSMKKLAPKFICQNCKRVLTLVYNGEKNQVWVCENCDKVWIN